MPFGVDFGKSTQVETTKSDSLLATMKLTVRTEDELAGYFRQKQNFLIGPGCITFDMEFPPVEDVTDILHRDPACKVRTPGGLDKEAETGFSKWVKTAPLEEIMEDGRFHHARFLP